MAGGTWSHTTGDVEAVNWTGGTDQANFDAAKAAVAGIIEILPGTEAVVPGLMGANQVLVRVTNSGIMAVTRIRQADGTDPTKLFFIDPSGIATATERIATAPDWSGLLLLPSSLGTAGQFLRSGGAGVQPAFATLPAITNALLDGANHTDTFARAVARGMIPYGNATPLWDGLPIGAADTFLGSNGTDPLWRTAPAVAAVLEHNLLFHLKPFTVSGNVSMGAGSAVITDALTTGRFANVRIGDRINLDDAHYPSSTYGMVATTSGATDPNNITMDRTNTGGAQTGATATIFPGDHWDHTLMAGLWSSGGYGTFDEGANPGGTVATMYGSFDYIGYGGGGTQRWGFEGATTVSNPNGFNWKKRGSTARMFVHVQDITTNRFVKLPNLDGTFAFTGGAQTITDKILEGGNEIRMDAVGGATGSHLADVTDPTKELYTDLTAITGAKIVAFKNYGGNAVVASNEGLAGQHLSSNGAGVAPSYGFPGIQSAVVINDHSIASATATEVTEMSLTLVAGTYNFMYNLICQSSNTGVGLLFGVNYTGTATRLVALLTWPDAGTSASTGVVDDAALGTIGQIVAHSVARTESTTAPNLNTGTGGVSVADVDLFMQVQGVIVVSDGGDLELWHGSEIATATRVEAGSNVIVTRVA